MRHLTPFLVAPVLLLAGCQVPRDEAAAMAARTASAAEPLVAQCQAAFAKSLGGLAVTSLGGPSVTNFGDAISVRLEAQPVDPNLIDARIYVCDFENGQMTHQGPG